MSPEVEKLLTPFYFGTISETDRLKMEQELLLDSETLVDYLDLKRKIEFAREIPQEPSASLWRRLEAELRPRKKLLFTLSFAAAGLAAACAVAFALFFSKPQTNGDAETNSAPILFDSHSGELAASANVL